MILSAIVFLTLMASPAPAADIGRFAGTWEVDVDRTLEEAKKSPTYKPEDKDRLPAIVNRMMAMLKVRITDTAVTYLRGSDELSVPCRVGRGDETSIVLVLSQGGQDFTLTLTVRDGTFLNMKSSASDDFDYDIWKRAPMMPPTGNGPDSLIRAAEERVFAAIKARDVTALGAELTDDFVHSAIDGAELDRRAFLQAIEKADYTILEIGGENMRVRVLDDLAILSGLQRVRVKLADGTIVNGTTSFVDVFVHVNNRWLLRHAVSVELPQP